MWVKGERVCEGVVKKERCRQKGGGVRVKGEGVCGVWVKGEGVCGVCVRV